MYQGLGVAVKLEHSFGGGGGQYHVLRPSLTGQGCVAGLRSRAWLCSQWGAHRLSEGVCMDPQ